MSHRMCFAGVGVGVLLIIWAVSGGALDARGPLAAENRPSAPAAGDSTGTKAGSSATKTYPVRRRAGDLRIDGRLDEPAWQAAVAERGFSFPWKNVPAPFTEFRALWDDRHLYFAFEAEDADLVVLDRLRDEEDAVLEDRAELYFSRDEQLKDYFCLEIDPKGRRFDYRGTFYRKLDPHWNLAGIECAGQIWDGRNGPHAGKRGYTVEGRIELAGFAAFKFPAIAAGSRIRAGIFRAEFSHDRSGKGDNKGSFHTRGRSTGGPAPIEEWISWVHPGTKEPDFHVPSSLGFLEFVR